MLPGHSISACPEDVLEARGLCCSGPNSHVDVGCEPRLEPRIHRMAADQGVLDV
jgi:hypothetical protein